MGPHFFKCGKLRERRPRNPNLKQLQWGRTFSSAERRCGERNSDSSSGASMGPHFFKCGKQRRGKIQSASGTGFNGAALFQVRKGSIETAPLKPLHWLQWGRTFSSAESFLNRCFLNLPSIASMGPHFFKCGKFWAMPMARAGSRRASMGPHFFKCGKKGR